MNAILMISCGSQSFTSIQTHSNDVFRGSAAAPTGADGQKVYSNDVVCRCSRAALAGANGVQHGNFQHDRQLFKFQQGQLSFKRLDGKIRTDREAKRECVYLDGRSVSGAVGLWREAEQVTRKVQVERFKSERHFRKCTNIAGLHRCRRCVEDEIVIAKQ